MDTSYNSFISTLHLMSQDLLMCVQMPAILWHLIPWIGIWECMKIQQRMVESDRGVRAENFCVCILAKTEEATTSVYDIWFYSGWNHPHSHKSLRSIQLRLSNCCQQIPPLASIAWISRPAEPATPPSPIPSPRWNNQPPQIFAHPRTPTVGKKRCSTRTKPTCLTYMGDDHIHHIGVNLARPTKILSLPRRVDLERVAKATHAMKCQTIITHSENHQKQTLTVGDDQEKG